jgi:hypothetical protein
MGFLRGLGAVAGRALKTVGTIGAAALKPLGTIAGSAIARNVVNRIIDAAPLPGMVKNVAKGAVETAASFVTSGKAAQFVDKIRGAGAKLEALSGDG